MAATFHSLMDHILVPHQAYPLTHIADVIIFTEIWDQRMEALWMVLQELRGEGLTTNPAKYMLAQRETRYLGFQVGQGQIYSLEDKVRALTSCEQSRIKKQVCFNGLANYCHKVIMHFSEKAAPLRSNQEPPTKQNPVATCCTKTSEQIKQALCQSLILYTQDFNQPFIVQMDALGTMIGVVLT